MSRLASVLIMACAFVCVFAGVACAVAGDPEPDTLRLALGFVAAVAGCTAGVAKILDKRIESKIDQVSARLERRFDDLDRSFEQHKVPCERRFEERGQPRNVVPPDRFGGDRR